MMFDVIASAAKQSIEPHGAAWIASSQALLAMTALRNERYGRQKFTGG
jgi:hypothetical protein